MPLPRTKPICLALSPALDAPTGESTAHLVGETFVHMCALMTLAAQIVLLPARPDPPQASGVSTLPTDLGRWDTDPSDGLQKHRASTSSAPPHVVVVRMALNQIASLLHGRSTQVEQHARSRAIF